MHTVRPYSPLRYPGGKASISQFLAELAFKNSVTGGNYAELYAGGAGAALNLLFNDVYEKIHINDLDRKIYSMWYSIINHTSEFIKILQSTPVTLDEWHRQKEIYNNPGRYSHIEIGFATFFLNRTNRSGIIHKAGPIGGYNQTGNYLIDARYNKKNLIERIERISSLRSRIKLTGKDAIEIIDSREDNTFIYLDPPYYNKSRKIYLNNFDHQDHTRLSKKMKGINDSTRWLISYDYTPEIVSLYKGFRMAKFDLNYSLQQKKKGCELLIFSDNLEIGDAITVNNRKTDLIFLNQ